MSDQPVTDREGLNQLLEGRSDDEINAFVNEMGVEQLLDQVFAGMQEAFVPERAAGQNAVTQWDVKAGDGVHSRQVVIADGTCTVRKETDETPRLTLALSLPDFLRFVSGQLDGMQAFMGGKLRLTGDLMLAQTMQAWFNT